MSRQSAVKLCKHWAKTGLLNLRSKRRLLISDSSYSWCHVNQEADRKPRSLVYHLSMFHKPPTPNLHAELGTPNRETGDCTKYIRCFHMKGLGFVSRRVNSIEFICSESEPPIFKDQTLLLDY